MREEIEKLWQEIQQKLERVKSLGELQKFQEEFLGKKSRLSALKPRLKQLPAPERKRAHQEIILLRERTEEAFKRKKREILQQEKIKEEAKEFFDPTFPVRKRLKGHLHPLTIVEKEIIEIFERLGFEVAEGPEIETEWYNFDALNIPQDHPARDAWDTFWLVQKRKKNKYLLRTHTSPVQVRFMERNTPPFRIISPGKVFRHEDIDVSHQIQFWQLEGLMVDKSTNVAEMKAILSEFFRAFFQEKALQFRLKPDFFPFTEPSFEISLSCLQCKGKGCEVCKWSGWLEVAGAGMVHPQVLKNSKLDPRKWQGWAFGFGIERLAMMRYGIEDLRLFLSGDLRFLTQF